MSKLPLAITRCALLTPLDDGSIGTWDALRAGRRVESSATVKDQWLQGNTQWDRSIRLALAVARQTVAGQDPAGISFFCGTSKGPVQTMLQACAHLRQGQPLTEIEARQITLGPAAMAAILRHELQLTGPAHTSVAACSSGLYALHRAAAAIRRGECERALVVAADASLHPLFEASFDRLGVLAPANPQGIRRCEPFSNAGQGFFLIEAAAALMLESANSPPAKSPLAPPIAWLENSWIGADSTNLIAIDPRAQSLRAGLRALQPITPAFIHAHATGTAHDAYELAALRDTFPSTPIFSHKKNLGHSLGAAALLSVVISALSHQKKQTPAGAPIPPNATSITIAQGFGGHVGIAALRGNSPAT